MGNIKKILVALLAAVMLVGCSSKGNTADANIVTELKEETEITFWHAMNGKQEEALKKLTDDFMAANPKVKVKLQNQSSYNELRQKVSATLVSAKDLPTITQAYPAWMYNATLDKLVQDLTPYIENKTIGLEDYSDIVEGFREGGKIEGVTYGLPFNKSTEVLYYNKTLLDELGLKAPTTLEELQEVSKTVKEKKNIVGAGFDSLNNYYATGLINKGVEFNKDMDVTGKESVEVAKYYQDGIKDGYFRIAGTDKYLSGPFGNGLLAMNVGSTAGESHVKKSVADKFEVGVVKRPEKISLQQGTDIYMFTSATPDQKTAAFEFMKHLVSKEAQLYWAKETGYIPVRTSVIESDDYQNSGSMIAPLIKEITKDVFTIPVSASSDSAYNEATAKMEELLSDVNKTPESVMESFKTSLSSIWQ